MKKLLLCTLALLACLLMPGCKRESSDIGLDLIDNLVGTTFTDTVTLQAYSELEDTISTTNLSANILGHLSDPVFGDSEAGIYAEFALAGDAVNFGEAPSIDSVVLTLQISGYYGDTNSTVGIRVHRLTESLDSETTYHQDATMEHDPTPINQNLNGYTLRPNTSMVVDTGVYNAHMRIRLSPQFGQELLNHQAELNNDFSGYLPGLYITAVSHTGNRGYMLTSNMTSALTGITLYYHNANEQNKRYTFPCSDKCVRFTHISHNYETSQSSDFVEEVLQNQHAIGQEVLYVQGGGGVKTHITFPNLEHAFDHLDKRVVIHRAELVVTDMEPSNPYLTHPTALTLQGIGKSDSAIRFIPDDDYYTSVAYYGGTYDASKHEYRFRVTKWVQQLILQQGDWSNSINLIVRGSGVRPHRLVLDGTHLDSPTRLRLEIAYSTY